MSDYNGNTQNNQPQQRPKTVLSHRSITMWTPNGEGKSAMLTWDIKKNEVLLVVRTNMPSDANNDHGRIQAQIPPDYHYMILEMLKAAALSEVPVRWAYEHKDRKFIGQGKMTDGPVLHYRIVVGRGEDGVVYLSVLQDKRPPLKFSFLNSNKSSFKDNDGNEMPKALESKFVTLGKVKFLEEVSAALIDRHYKHPEPKQQGGNGGQGNNNYNRGNQGGGSSYGGNSTGGGGGDMKDEEIPW